MAHHALPANHEWSHQAIKWFVSEGQSGHGHSKHTQIHAMAPMMRAFCLMLLCFCYVRFSVAMDADLLPRRAEIPPLRTLAAEVASKQIGVGVAELVVNTSGWSATFAPLSTDRKGTCRPCVSAGANGPFVSNQDVEDCLLCVTDNGSCSSSSGSSSSSCSSTEDSSDSSDVEDDSNDSDDPDLRFARQLQVLI